MALVATLSVSTRHLLARRSVSREAQAPLPAAPELAPTSQLEILPLYEEASAGDGFISGHGVSYLIRTDSVTVLLDVGHNPLGGIWGTAVPTSV